MKKSSIIIVIVINEFAPNYRHIVAVDSELKHRSPRAVLVTVE
jgi:hypothetical protein